MTLFDRFTETSSMDVALKAREGRTESLELSDVVDVLASFGLDPEVHVAIFRKEEHFYNGSRYENIVRYCVDWALRLNFYAVRDCTQQRRAYKTLLRSYKQNRHTQQNQSLIDSLQENILGSKVYKWSGYPDKDVLVGRAYSPPSSQK